MCDLMNAVIHILLKLRATVRVQHTAEFFATHREVVHCSCGAGCFLIQTMCITLPFHLKEFNMHYALFKHCQRQNCSNSSAGCLLIQTMWPYYHSSSSSSNFQNVFNFDSDIARFKKEPRKLGVKRGEKVRKVEES